MTLDAAIRQLLHLGHKDPVDIVRELQRRHGKKWLRDQVADHAEEFVLGMAQKMLGVDRRSVEPARLQASNTSSELMLKAKFVPEVGWKRIGDLTAEDCRAVAGHYRTLAVAASVRGRYFEQLADLIKAQRVKKVSEIRGDLPLFELEQVA